MGTIQTETRDPKGEMTRVEQTETREKTRWLGRYRAALEQEQALVDYFVRRQDEVSRRIGRPVDLAMLKPYTGTHNSGYTECQEFYGAITLNSEEPLGRQIVTMLDVAARGFGSRWDEVIIPEFDYVLVEKTLGKFGREVEVFNDLPIRLQHLVGSGY